MAAGYLHGANRLGGQHGDFASCPCHRRQEWLWQHCQSCSNKDALCPASVAALVPGWHWAPGAGWALRLPWPTALQPPCAHGECSMAAQHTLVPGSSVGELASVGGLSSAMGLTLSAVEWGTVYPLSSPNHFLLFLLVLLFFERVVLLSPLPPAMGPPACACYRVTS